MQTGTIERQREKAIGPELGSAMSKAGASRPQTLPRPRPEQGAPAALAPAAAPTQHARGDAELDAMLRRDPNTGAVRGLRVALLLNAGLALTGLIAWELWALLAI